MSNNWPVYLSVIAASVAASSASSDANYSGYSYENLKCSDGLMIPAWLPLTNLTVSERFSRGVVYFLAMCYLFLGISIASDRFMAAIEMITSKEREIKVKQRNGETQIVVVRLWNETVANLTLMALGSSAPEILLSIIEIMAKNFQAGELGPGTIVGSAAYNLFVIIALCIVVIPDGETRKIKHLRVFFVTTTWSLFAYVWLYLILARISPGRLEIWEGLLTFLFFPATVLTAYIADRRLLIYKYLDKSYRINKRGLIVTGQAGDDVEMGNEHCDVKHLEDTPNGVVSQDTQDFEESRREFLGILQDFRQKFPQRSIEDIERMALEQLLDKAPKSRAFYKMQGNRAFTGRANPQKRLIQARAESDLEEIRTEIRRSFSAESSTSDDLGMGKVLFCPAHYTVMESCGQVELKVIRRGGLWQTCTVEYETEDGTAEAGSDFGFAKGVLTFQPGNDEQSIFIDVVDDDVFELDEVFYVRLFNTSDTVALGNNHVATVMILDDDHAGYFTLAEQNHELVESVGSYELVVKRLSGARGAVRVPFWTEDGTAKAGKDYEAQQGIVLFDNNEVEKVIQLGIVEEGSYEKDVLFYVNLGEPQMVEDDELAALIQAAEAKAPEDLTEEDKMALLGRPKAGDIVRAQLRIKESKEFKNTVDKLVQRANASLLIGTSSWKEQFTEALTVSPGGDDNEDYEEGEEPRPSCGDYIMHFLTLFWKLLFAFIPPTDISGGYLCFFVSIVCIGLVTAVIGDVASHFGCTLGIKDSVTAIVFVALGTSVPDTFASKVAAIQDKYADASVGNVTGSNAVNVFLGIGVAWTIAAIYHEINGTAFEVEPGNLAFSVTLFCSEALIAILVLLIRRSKAVGGELGGPKGIKYLSGAVLLGLWLIYLIMSTLEAYHVIPGF